ncbi:metal ABC transporter ATP-binding protein [Intrasporangium calvum]|uniref:ABC transporter related protein n=1 Tax=Intrasporangium calvum (strain ATCC 23552 / DSM 43043 / JCM 3097 / NBRC 12989 / NCIMB 10167 / NRRL B-3866 / 7 KIP) TaxID=710696 RepID=E6SDI0_INTC7|nr:metal ABC transporter ATP-binding protein [Intrasporangium calvum]ADU48632.1 ABC transporter related protein [Intrasporangium calvum DSM 43043]AXG13632.1 metal ABC transporter ATP-binding protein [Intrasporangium calvum]
MSAIIELTDASFGYGRRPVLTGASLTVERGEVVAVLGPNGAGKSTLMKGILGLNHRLGGMVTLFGTPADELRDRARIGYVPQRHTLSSSVRATAEEIVESGRLPRLGWHGRLRATDRQIVCRSLDLVGLADRAGTEVSTLSGGQQRRVLIARALAGQPDVLIMDEPTAGVDAASQHVLADVLGRLVERGVTMVIVTHELGALRSLLSRIIVVDRGRIVFDGDRERYAARRGLIHHDHDSHHHDLELTPPPGAVVHGPLDPFDPRGRTP